MTPSEGIKTEDSGELAVSNEAFKIVQDLHKGRFTLYGAKEVLKRAEIMVERSANKRIIDDPEGPADCFGNLKKNPDAEAPGI